MQINQEDQNIQNATAPTDSNHSKQGYSVKKIWEHAFQNISRHYTQVLKQSWLFFFCLSLITYVATQLVHLANKEADPSMPVYLAIGIVVSILATALYPIAIAHAQLVLEKRTQDDLPTFVTKNIKLVLIEYLRTFPRIILYLLAFVVPGLIQTAKLIFVPYVVLLHGSYRKGLVDALDQSSKLSYGSLLGVFLFTMCGFIGTYVFSYGPIGIAHFVYDFDSEGLEIVVIDFFGEVVLSTLFQIAFYLGLLGVFEKLVLFKEGKHELAL